MDRAKITMKTSSPRKKPYWSKWSTSLQLSKGVAEIFTTFDSWRCRTSDRINIRSASKATGKSRIINCSTETAIIVTDEVTSPNNSVHRRTVPVNFNKNGVSSARSYLTTMMSVGHLLIAKKESSTKIFFNLGGYKKRDWVHIRVLRSSKNQGKGCSQKSWLFNKPPKKFKMPGD